MSIKFENYWRQVSGATSDYVEQLFIILTNISDEKTVSISTEYTT